MSIEGGFIEIVIGGEKRRSDPKYTMEQIKCAAETLIKAKEVEENEEMLTFVKAYIEQYQDTMKKVGKDMKGIKPKSIQDLRNMSNSYEESEDGEE